MQDPTNQNLYTVWEWYDAPYQIRTHAPLNWEKGTWIIRIEPGVGFPYTEWPVHNRPDWDVVQMEIDGRWYAFIRDPEDLAWPSPNLKGFAFGVAMPTYDNVPLAHYEVPKTLLGTKSSNETEG